MPDDVGDEQELAGKRLFDQMQIPCVHPRTQVLLQQLDSTETYSRGQNLEFDYLIPRGRTCFIGEMSATRNPESARQAYTILRRHLDVVRHVRWNDAKWTLMGVPADQLYLFREVRHFKGVFITPFLQEFDVRLSPVSGVALLYARDWAILQDYAQSLGHYASPHLLHHLGVSGDTSRHAITLGECSNQLIRLPSRTPVSGIDDLADLFTFIADPYELLGIARVYRRDELPALTTIPESDYQRLLIPGKLSQIRQRLLTTPDFTFPNSILVVLSNECEYDEQRRHLVIPVKYGAISVIDGQHRLFSYASDPIRQRMGGRARLMVAAIKFVDTPAQEVVKYSARLFVEINLNQTPIERAHLDAISYQLLDDTDRRSVAAEVLLQVNRLSQGKAYGLFTTSETNLGIIPASTILVPLRSLCDLKAIQRLQRARPGSHAEQRGRGYENLFEKPIADLGNAAAFVEAGTNCLSKYFNFVGSTFSHDWPRRGRTNTSSLRHAKVFAAFVRLLAKFIDEGRSWDYVQAELTTIRDNIVTLRDLPAYSGVLLDSTDSRVPGSQPSASDNFRFLQANRSAPTSIQNA